jgi:hypothetical protein
MPILYASHGNQRNSPRYVSRGFILSVGYSVVPVVDQEEYDGGDYEKVTLVLPLKLILTSTSSVPLWVLHFIR